MEKHNLVNTMSCVGERVTSSYAEIYFNDENCDHKHFTKKSEETLGTKIKETDVWVSPSDLLIGLVDLKPPFTSKITRGITHEGVLGIGNGVLEKEHDVFLKTLARLIDDNNLSWIYVQEEEKTRIIKKVKQIFHDVFTEKSKIMEKEIALFYERSLMELEDHVKTELDNVLIGVNAGIISDLNNEIHEKLSNERAVVEKVLVKRYENEVRKIKLYYKLLLNNELFMKTKLINRALYERNDVLNAFCRLIETENLTRTMYVMCTERKKCKITQFLLENLQSSEITEKLQKIKEQQTIIGAYKEQGVHILDINKKWEEKVTKILQLFLKFISFSLKLLPEQATFLLNLEKMVILQLNEIQKHPSVKPVSILIEEDYLTNIFKFEETPLVAGVCERDPFLIEGDLADSIPTPYGSQDTIPLDVELPFIRLQRQYIYAKCQKMEQVRAFLESQRCNCRDKPYKSLSDSSTSSIDTLPLKLAEQKTPSLHESQSSNYESLLVEDIHRLHACPGRGCQNWMEKLAFPDIDSYLDFTEENFARVIAILDKLPAEDRAPELASAKDIAYSELLFAATKEPRHDVGTQYCSQEDLLAPLPVVECPCISDYLDSRVRNVAPTPTPSININQVIEKRKESLKRLMQDYPKLVELFTDESYDFQL